ncbi:MAG: ammonium transporter, partial [Candidatus Latescibacteria bacterium]|nr:ammonium transporter [Candidatus Latescibacterota bacterium]
MVDNLWILIAAALVFVMHLGFATLETGLTRQKNTVNILFKNVFIINVGIITYALTGFNTMYPGAFNDFISLGGPIGFEDDVANLTAKYADYTYWSDFIFQAMFAATAATIVSGAVAERVKLTGFMAYATILVAFFYPIAGSWKWGGGWLDGMGFYDFAGSSVVHAFGGFSALAVVLVLGARRGKYTDDGQVRPILGHSMPLATIGVFLLWLGWFGFNGGSVLSADPELVSLVFVTTCLAAAAGCLTAMFTSQLYLKKPDI